MTALLAWGALAGLSVPTGALGRVSVFGYYAGAWANRGPLVAQVFAEGFPSRGEGAYRVSALTFEGGAELWLGPWRLSGSVGGGLLYRSHIHASESYPVGALGLSVGLFKGPGAALTARLYPGRESFLWSVGFGLGYGAR